MSRLFKRQNLSRAPLLFWLMFSRNLCLLHKKISCQALQQQIHCRSLRTTLFVASESAHNMVAEESQSLPTRAKLVSQYSLEDCGARLRKGNLVAFPTETVYGLGCNALDPTAILKVFEAKERPLTDPLITHVTRNSDAFDLWNADESSVEGKALGALCDTFWPGPLTLVSKAAPHVPPSLMANTGFVACRAPQHPISIALINAAKVPIAAPSANKFGHVSPTRANHVWDDLMYEDVWIVETDQNSSGVCDVGVESSVVKIEISETGPSEKGRITLLRQGAISADDIQRCLRQAGLGNDFVVVTRTKKMSDNSVPEVCPGQTIRHYSPDIPSSILSPSCYESRTSLTSIEQTILSTTVLIDFGGKLKKWKECAIAYRDLSASGISAEATKSVFETLRWAEQVEGANQILFPEIADDKSEKLDALSLALKDRLTRAASGVVIHSLLKK
jgi:tRNA threonylcarbamoyl adenosine modification protein (Sua5/YciO/YrdC/YwlC family)